MVGSENGIFWFIFVGIKNMLNGNFINHQINLRYYENKNQIFGLPSAFNGCIVYSNF